MIGTKLGPYEITAKLGEGGMGGEVYRATDTKLKRDVAIKVLPAAFTEDKERLQRFEREAQLLAQLHHPNIASIFGLEESDGTRALVMELVEGPTLAERSATRSPSQSRSPMRSRRLTRKGSSTAISSLKTSKLPLKGKSKSWISDWRRRWTRWARFRVPARRLRSPSRRR
ncbi:MAG: serine/threonine protein kinase [Candidatus Binatia bacterium]